MCCLSLLYLQLRRLPRRRRRIALLCRLRRKQSIDQTIHIPVENPFQRIQCQIDAMIAHAALRKIIRADSLRTVRRANLRTPLPGNALLLRCAFSLIELGT